MWKCNKCGSEELEMVKTKSDTWHRFYCCDCDAESNSLNILATWEVE